MPLDLRTWILTAVIFLILAVPLAYLIRVMYMLGQGVVVVDDADEPEEEETDLTCSNCNRPLEAEWRSCPHCGTEIPREADAQ